MDADQAREHRIQAYYHAMLAATDPAGQRIAMEAMAAEIRERSPEQVARMEMERGLQERGCR